ncbi:Cytochrome c-type biogenesis protein CcmF [bacterium HR39]|nr:Cytochrome c-type biogenesis protein CcmF [bacterium HR39]
MIEYGHFALALAFGVALLQFALPVWGAARREAVLMDFGRQAAVVQFVLVSFAFFALIHAHVTDDFSVRNVFENSHSTKPWIYKFAGTWGNHEGSLVLWVWILALFGAGVALWGRELPPTFLARALAIQGLVGAGFYAFVLFTSNAFERLDPVPADGRGLNPILQDPGLAMHPPMLYLGYVGFSTAYAFAMAALIEGRVDPGWARWLRPWVLLAWTFLTLGIALGSWWAYYELGWGGYWFWDPVENASFMPWLAGTALLHSAIVLEKRNTLKNWTILLAILTFSLSLLGTFLVRSGVLTSVHAFANDPDRGVFVLALLALAVGGSLVLYAWRAPAMQGGPVFAPISREGALVLNNLLLASACATVFIGTLYPLGLEAVTGEKISVGPPYFNATFVPIMVPLLLAVPVGAMLAWKRGDLPGVLQRLWLAAVLALVAAMVPLALADWRSPLAALGLALAVWVIVGSLVEFAERIQLFRIPLARSLKRAAGLPRSAFGLLFAHLGLGLVVLGITVSATGQIERILVMKPGETAELAGYTVRFDGVEKVRGPNWIADRGIFTVLVDGEPLLSLHSDRRFYPVERRNTTEAGISTTPLRDLYFVLGDPADGGGWAVRLYYNPQVFWIWGGAAFMALGGFVSLSDRRLRVGAPAPARTAPAAAARGA